MARQTKGSAEPQPPEQPQDSPPTPPEATAPAPEPLMSVTNFLASHRVREAIADTLRVLERSTKRTRTGWLDRVRELGGHQ